MELKTALLGDVPTLVAIGDLDHNTCGLLQEALEKLFASRYNVIFLDFGDVGIVDSGGLSVLRAAVASLGHKGWLGIIGANEDVRRLLEIGGLLPHANVRLFDNRHAAVRVTGERAST